MPNGLLGRKDIDHPDRKELKEVKDRLSKVEQRVKYLDAQVKIIRRERDK